MISVVIADDHTMFRQLLAMLLRSSEEFCVAGEAADGIEALKLIEETSPDIAVLDVSMPGLTGMQVLGEVRKKGWPTRVVLLTMHTETQLAAEAMEEGVSGYVLKGNAFEDLIQALRCVNRGGTFISSIVTKELLSSRKSANPDRVNLTPREREVLRCIASGMTARQIADVLFISIKTVETHRSRLMEKLDLHTTASLVRYAIKRGIADP